MLLSIIFLEGEKMNILKWTLRQGQYRIVQYSKSNPHLWRIFWNNISLLTKIHNTLQHFKGITYQVIKCWQRGLFTIFTYENTIMVFQPCLTKWFNSCLTWIILGIIYGIRIVLKKKKAHNGSSKGILIIW